MNLYLRYFDNEVLVSTVDEAIDFLSSIPEIKMTPDLENDIREYVAADAYYPKRYKVRPRVYFIIIKTEAACMADFKARRLFAQFLLTLHISKILSSLVSMPCVQVGMRGLSVSSVCLQFLPQASVSIVTLSSVLR